MTKLLAATDLDPSPIERMLATGGIAFENPTHAARAYDIWPNRECAKKAMDHNAGRGIPNDLRGWGHLSYKSTALGECPRSLSAGSCPDLPVRVSARPWRGSTGRWCPTQRPQ